MHAKHGKGGLTQAQLTADRANLAKARAAVSHSRHHAVSAAQLAGLAKGRAAAHAKHPKGSQTPAQLAAERRNLAKARSKASHHGRKKGSKNLVHHARSASSGHSLHTRGGMRGMKRPRAHPLGSHLVRSSYAHHLSVRKPTGVNHRFKRHIAPTSSGQRTAWKSARTHHFKKRLHIRKPRTMHLKDWRGTRKRLTPR